MKCYVHSRKFESPQSPVSSQCGGVLLRRTPVSALHREGGSAVLPFPALNINLFIAPLLSFIPRSLGIIMTAVADLDRETQDRYELVVKATDMAGQMGGLSGSTTVTIVITDVNDNPPRFTQSESPTPPSGPLMSCYSPETKCKGSATPGKGGNVIEEGGEVKCAAEKKNLKELRGRCLMRKSVRRGLESQK